MIITRSVILMIRNGIKTLFCGLLVCVAFGISNGVVAQVEPPKAKPSPAPKVKGEIHTTAPYPPVYFKGGETSEKSIKVDANVNLKLCVLQGNLKINGWEHNELRVFVKKGSPIGLKVLEKDKDSGKPIWVLVSGMAKSGAPGQTSECLSGESIELDVPLNSSLRVEGRSTETMVDSVKTIIFKTDEGNISLRNITGGITAVTYQGDLMVENSGGAISLETTTGNIVAYEVGPGQVGDLFKAKTNSGTISLQKVEHRQIESNSITGSVVFNGRFLPGGLYNFKTSNGAIRLTIPIESSCKIIASFGYGNFNSAFPLKILTENIFEGGKSIVANIGAGDATVKVTTSSGSIGIKKQ